MVFQLQRTLTKPRKKDVPKLTDDEIHRLADYYRAQYPFRSLRDRLAYEKSLPADRPSPTLTEASKKWLKSQEDPAYNDGLRSRALAIVHSDNVSRFITQEGFGMSRMQQPSPAMLALPEAKAIALPVEPTLSSGHLESSTADIPSEEPTADDLD